MLCHGEFADGMADGFECLVRQKTPPPPLKDSLHANVVGVDTFVGLRKLDHIHNHLRFSLLFRHIDNQVIAIRGSELHHSWRKLHYAVSLDRSHLLAAGNSPYRNLLSAFDRQ